MKNWLCLCARGSGWVEALCFSRGELDFRGCGKMRRTKYKSRRDDTSTSGWKLRVMLDARVCGEMACAARTCVLGNFSVVPGLLRFLIQTQDLRPGLASWVFSVVPGGTCLGDLVYPGLNVLGYSRSSLRDLVLSFAPRIVGRRIGSCRRDNSAVLEPGPWLQRP